MTSTLSPEFIQARENFAAWYDAKSEDEQLLIDEISDRTSFIIDEDEYDEFIKELADYGITDASTFEDAFASEIEGYGERVLGEFAEAWCDGTSMLAELDNDAIVHCIDWNQYWYYAMQYDFIVIEVNCNTYFFYNHY